MDYSKVMSELDVNTGINDCIWKYDEYHDMYDTACGRAFSFITGDCDENGYRYCPWCGNQIRVENQY